MRAEPLSVRVADDFAALARDWDELHERAPAASFFNSGWWQAEWWKAYGGGRPLRLLVAERAGAAAGILPLYLGRERVHGISVEVARLVGSGGDTFPDDLGPVFADPDAGRALALGALQLGADVVDLPDLDTRGGFPEIAVAVAADAGWRASRSSAQRIPYIELPPSWDAFLASLSAARRAGIRKVRRKLAAEAAVRFRVWEDAATLGDAFERLVFLHHRRWDAAGDPSASFRSDAYLAFHRAVMEAALRRGQLRLYCLELDGEIVAMLYACRFRRAIYVVQAGFDPAHARRRVGKALLEHAIEHAIGEGNAVFDFLRGEHPYKDQIATASRETSSVTLLRRGPRASAWALRERTLPRWKRGLKRLLRRG